MPKQVTQLEVFVASPGDVDEERQRVRKVIDNVNNDIGEVVGLRLDYVGWEDDVAPGIGQDAQAVVNRQTRPADMVIGIFWKRLGTPSRRAPSGTVEELKQAIARKKRGEQLNVLSYFRTQPFYTRSVEECEQFIGVLNFRGWLQKQGALVWEHRSPDDFEDQLRKHLTRLIRGWRTQPIEPVMDTVPAGPFLMGNSPGESLDRNEQPRHEVPVAAFRIARHAVTNEQLERFIEDRAYERRDLWTAAGWRWVSRHRGSRPRPHFWNDWGLADPGHRDHPAQWLSWYEARAYARWLASKTAKPYRLPTEAEWEKAAGWDAAARHTRRYPWGDEFDPKRCNFRDEWDRARGRIGTLPVGSFDGLGTSPCGAEEMSGQVFEWTSSLRLDYPYDPEDGREDAEAAGDRVFRGGCWANKSEREDLGRCASRYKTGRPSPPGMNGGEQSGPIGLRLAITVPAEPEP